MPHTYALYPWSWNAAESCHEPPEGAFAVLDLRPEAEQARAGQSLGWGFFAWPDMVPGNGPNIAPPTDAVTLGYGDCRELLPDTATRDELRLKLGLSTNPSGTTLIDCVSDVLGSLADPTGQNGPKPLLPTREGLIEIHLANHSRVLMQAFDASPMFGNSATGRHNRIRDVIRTDLETAAKAGGPSLVAKVLGGLLDRWGVDYSQAAKWRNLMRPALLADMLGKSGGKFNPRKPQTSYTDDFNRANGTLGAAWTAVSGTWSIASNAVTNGTSGVQAARYESDLSSSDHWATLTQVSGGSASNRVYGAVRFAAAATTFYGGDGTSGGFNLCKVVSGTSTTLASNTGTTIDTCETRANGSTISITRTAGSDISLTDTSITGNTRGGMAECAASGSTGSVDNWSVDDGITAAGSIFGLLLMGCGT